MKVIGYVRVSTIDQNLDLQLDAIKSYCDSKGWEYAIFQEKQSTRNTRPVKEEVLKLIRQRKYDGVVVYKLDRWGRSTRELVNELHEFTDDSILFVSVSQGIDLSSSWGKMMAGFLSVMAEFERDLISERTKAGMASAKARGKHVGRPKKKKEVI